MFILVSPSMDEAIKQGEVADIRYICGNVLFVFENRLQMMPRVQKDWTSTFQRENGFEILYYKIKSRKIKIYLYILCLYFEE